MIKKNNIVLKTANGAVVLNYQIKTQDGWVAGVTFFCKTKTKRAQRSKELKRKDNNSLHNELNHPFEDVTWAMGKAMGLNLIGTFKPCKACTLGKAKENVENMMTVLCSMVKG